MTRIKNQSGLAALLLVILIGLAVIGGVVGVASSLNAKKESSVASHAQTNVELMSWSGVSAFRQYLEKTGAEDVANIRDLAGTEVSLKSDNSKNITVKNIIINGCDTVDGICTTQADIISKSISGKAAATIQALFKLVVREGVVVPTEQRVGNYTAGSSHFLGAKLDSEVENTQLNLNIDGDFTVIPFVTAFDVSDNISGIALTVDGDVYIDCFFGCNKPRMDVTATGKVTLLNGGEYGDINANGNVTLGSLVEATPKVYEADQEYDETKDDVVVNPDADTEDNETTDIEDEDGNIQTVQVQGLNSGSITTNGNVTIRSTYVKGNVLAGGNVVIKRDSTITGNIKSNKTVSLEGILLASPQKTKVLGTITAVKDVRVSKAVVQNTVHAGQDVDVRNSGIVAGGEFIHAYRHAKVTLQGEAASNIYANGHVDVVHGGKVTGNIHAGAWVRVRFPSSKVTGNVYARGDTLHSVLTSGAVYAAGAGIKIQGDVYSAKDIVGVTGILVWDLKRISGNLYIDESHNMKRGTGTSSTGALSGSQHKKDSDWILAKINDGLPVGSVGSFEIPTVSLDVGTKVDVTKYKPDANYIFSTGKERGASRIYLNHLKNHETGITYMYKDGEQHAFDENGNSVSVNKEGFYLGKYDYNGTTYVGALCESINPQSSLVYKSGKCTSPIVGFFTRVGVGFDISVGDNLFGLPQAYGYDPSVASFLHDWKLRSRGAAKSTPENANLAPGVLYFEGNLHIKGDQAFDGSNGNAYANSILAEGNIDAVEWSPRIYSPYNIVREGDADLICNRDIKFVDGSGFNKNNTSPKTLSDKFLMPTNLCEDDDEFSYSMNKDENGDKIIFNIDGKDIEKLDLGYVALMSNAIIRVGSCSKIYGDVLAGNRLEASTAQVGAVGDALDVCSGSDGQTITGQVSIAGDSTSVFLDGTILVVPDEKYTNEGEHIPVDANENDSIENVKLQWTKFL